MTELDENLVPEPAPDVDPRSLDTQPSTEDFFVLSRLDGSTTIGQLCKTSGLGRQKTLECISNLRRYGLLQIPGADPLDSPPDSDAADAESAPEQTSSSPDSSTLEGDLFKRFPVPLEEFQFDRQLLSQTVELDDDFKREVLFVHEQLDDVDYYRLLGIERSAKRRDLRRAYFPLSKRYHPDRFYQKILGDYEPMIQRIFQRITKAYQTLSDRNKRREYDDSLRRGRATHATPQMASTPAARSTDSQESMQGDRKRAMAYRVLVQRGDRALKAGKVAAALKEYRKALTLQRKIELPLRVARTLVRKEQHLDDALAFARTANNIDSTNIDALKLIGKIYEQKGQLSDALYHYEQALAEADDDAELRARIDRLRH